MDDAVVQRRSTRSQVTIATATKKIFSRPSADVVKAMKYRYAEAFATAHRRSNNHSTCVTTFGPDKANIGTKTRMDIRQCLRFLDLDKGTPTKLIDVYLEGLCTHANQGLSRISGIDCHSPGTDPLLYSIPCGNIGRSGRDGSPIKKSRRDVILTRRQFWKLRYLFIPIIYHFGTTDLDREFHMDLCAVSPSKLMGNVHFSLEQDCCFCI